MRRVKYVYNEKTLQYEKLKLSKAEKFQKFIGVSSLIVFTSMAIFTIAYLYFPTPKEKTMEKEIQQMSYHFNNLSQDFTEIAKEVENLHQKDSEVHRMIFGIAPLDDAIWEGGTGGHKKYDNVLTEGVSKEMINSSLTKVDKLKRKVALQRASLDTLFHLAVAKEERLAAIPSIKPVREDRLKRKMRNLSGYGMRFHPVHKVKKFHKGIDFTATSGTAIQATGNGTVIRVENKSRGYGKNVIIDHGYGYTSLYAHMSSISVKKGQKVLKGQELGKVGSTGTSTAPHLHYEVRINGRAINPIDYCMDGLSPDEYKELVNMASVANQSFD